jgi:glucokinase
VSSELQPSVLSFDLGGSHITAAISTGRPLHVQAVLSRPISLTDTPAAFIQLLADMVDAVSTGFTPLPGASFAIGGPFDYQNGISRMHHKLPFLYGIDLKHSLATHFGWPIEQICFLNDGDAFLLGELDGGAARLAQRAVGITLGTGIGSAFAIDGHITTTDPGVPNGSELWNIPWAGGIVEDILSTRGLQQAYLAMTGLHCEVIDIAANAAHDNAAREVFEEFGSRLGEIFAATLTAFHPDIIVLGGGIARASRLFLPAATRSLHTPQAEIRISHLQDQAIVAGAASWAFEHRRTSLLQSP